MRIPSTNNALESNNNQIKKNYTLRWRLDISRFNIQLFNLRYMAKSYSNDNVYALAPAVSKEDWQEGILYARNDKQYHIDGSIDGARQIIYVLCMNTCTRAQHLTRPTSLHYNSPQTVASERRTHTYTNIHPQPARSDNTTTTHTHTDDSEAGQQQTAPDSLSLNSLVSHSRRVFLLSHQT